MKFDQMSFAHGLHRMEWEVTFLQAEEWCLVICSVIYGLFEEKVIIVKFWIMIMIASNKNKQTKEGNMSCLFWLSFLFVGLAWRNGNQIKPENHGMKWIDRKLLDFMSYYWPLLTSMTVWVSVQKEISFSLFQISVTSIHSDLQSRSMIKFALRPVGPHR